VFSRTELGYGDWKERNSSHSWEGDGTALPAEEGKRAGCEGTTGQGHRTDLPEGAGLQGEEDSALEMSETTKTCFIK